MRVKRQITTIKDLQEAALSSRSIGKTLWWWALNGYDFILTIRDEYEFNDYTIIVYEDVFMINGRSRFRYETRKKR